MEFTMAMLVAMCPQCRTEEEIGISADERIREWGPMVPVLVLCDDCRVWQKMLRDRCLAGDAEALAA
jgi:hypothetical protein